MSTLLSSEVIRQEDLPDATRMEMFQLFKDCFSTSRKIFLEDLADKQWVILLRESETGKLGGFTSLKIFDFEFQGTSMIVVYDGDTIIAPEFWGTTLLSKTWIKTVLEITRDDSRPVYWMLITSGFRTYRFLPVFYKEFYPCYTQETPPDSQALMDTLAEKLFGSEYLKDLGVVRFSTGATPLLKDLAEVDEGRLDDPHIAFYMQKNPGHIQGDELVCLTRIADDNYTPAGKRMLR
jgi:hypothetical protein